MRNPLESEETAFRFVLGTIVYLAPIVLASWIATWLGVIVFVVLTAVAVWCCGAVPSAAGSQHIDGRRSRTRGGSSSSPTRRCGGARLTRHRCAQGRRCRGGRARDLSGSQLAAADVALRRGWRPGRCGRTAQLEPGTSSTAAGVNARGDIGDGDPLQALEDALRAFPADEIVISTHPDGRSNWLERRTSSMRRALRFDVPVTHVDRRRIRSKTGPALHDRLRPVPWLRGPTCRRRSTRTPRRPRSGLRVSWPLNGGIGALPFVTRSVTRAPCGLRLVEVRADGPVAPASASVWQLPQPADAKTALPAAASPAPPPAVAVDGAGVVVAAWIAVRVADARDARRRSSRRPPRPGP